MHCILRNMHPLIAPFNNSASVIMICVNNAPDNMRPLIKSVCICYQRIIKDVPFKSMHPLSQCTFKLSICYYVDNNAAKDTWLTAQELKDAIMHRLIILIY